MEDKSKASIVWMPEAECPEAFWTNLKNCKTDLEGLELLCEAHEAGWITIYGQTRQNIHDLAAVLQEHFKVKVITNEPRNDVRRDRDE